MFNKVQPTAITLSAPWETRRLLRSKHSWADLLCATCQ